MLVIKKWTETFENSDSRKRQRLGWFLNPSGCESAGYIELMSHGARGVLAFGVFQAICQWSATNRQTVRGKLARSDGSALNVRQVAAVVRIPEPIVSDAVELLCSKDVGWLVDLDNENTASASVCHQSATNLPASATNLPASASDLPALLKEKEKEKEKEKKTQGVVFPSDLDTDEFREAWADWESFRKEIKHSLTNLTIKAQLKKFEAWGVVKSIAAIRTSIENGWQGLFEPTGANSSAGVEDDWLEVMRFVKGNYSVDVKNIGDLERRLKPEQFAAIKAVGVNRIVDWTDFDKDLPAAYRKARFGG